MSHARYPFADLALSRRLETTEGRASAAFIDARACLHPGSGAAWTRVAGAYALFDEVGSPLTQSFGLGVAEPAGGAELAALEAFFHERGAGVSHEVSPLADPALVGLLAGRGYRPVELTSVLFRPIGPEVRVERPRDERLRTRPVGPDEADLWAETAARGWSESAEAAAFMRDFGRISARSQGTVPFLAELDGEPVATGGLFVGGGTALLAGASTVPGARGRGAQLALLEARLRHAAEHGCDLAMMAALPGSGSQRNAERQGFRIAYTRIKWELHGANA